MIIAVNFNINYFIYASRPIPLGVAHSILNRVNETPSDLQNLLDCNRFLKLEPIFTRL